MTNYSVVSSQNLAEKSIEQWTDEESFKKLLDSCGESILFHEYRNRSISVLKFAQFIERYKNFKQKYADYIGKFDNSERAKACIADIKVLIGDIDRDSPMNENVLLTQSGRDIIKEIRKELSDTIDLFRRRSNLGLLMGDDYSITGSVDGKVSTDIDENGIF